MTAPVDPLAFPIPAPWQWRVQLAGDLAAPCTCAGAMGEPECAACVEAAAVERATWARLAWADEDEEDDDPEGAALADEVRAETSMQED